MKTLITVSSVLLVVVVMGIGVRGSPRSKPLDDGPVSKLQLFQQGIDLSGKSQRQKKSDDSEIDLDISSEMDDEQQFSFDQEPTSQDDPTDSDDDELDFSQDKFEISDSSLDTDESEFIEVVTDDDELQSDSPKESKDESQQEDESQQDDEVSPPQKNKQSPITKTKQLKQKEEQELNLIKKTLENSMQGLIKPLIEKPIQRHQDTPKHQDPPKLSNQSDETEDELDDETVDELDELNTQVQDEMDDELQGDLEDDMSDTDDEVDQSHNKNDDSKKILQHSPIQQDKLNDEIETDQDDLSSYDEFEEFAPQQDKRLNVPQQQSTLNQGKQSKLDLQSFLNLPTKSNGVFFIQKEQSEQTEQSQNGFLPIPIPTNPQPEDQQQILVAPPQTIQQTILMPKPEVQNEQTIQNKNPYLEQKLNMPKPETLGSLLKQQHFPEPQQIEQSQADIQLAQAMSQIQSLQSQMQILLASTAQPQISNLDQQKKVIESITTQIVDKQEQQIMVQSVIPVIKDQDGISCKDESEPVCLVCQAEDYYQLDEENWYLIGLEHHYKREFQILLQGVKDQVGISTIRIAFSQSNDICFSVKSLAVEINLTKVLQYFTNQPLTRYLQNSIVQIPDFVKAQSMQTMAKYNPQDKKFSFEQFKLYIEDKLLPVQLSSNGSLSIEKIEFDQDQISMRAEGFISFDNSRAPFYLSKHESNGETELVRFKSLNILVKKVVSGILLPDQSSVLFGVTKVFFGDGYINVIKRHLQSTHNFQQKDLTHPLRKQLKIITKNKDIYQISFQLSKQE